MPVVLTETDEPVEPLLHFNVPEQPEAVSVADSVPQSSVLLALTIGEEGAVPFVMITAFDAEPSPHEPTHDAVYVPLSETVIELPDEPLLHLIVPEHPVAERTDVSFPHKLVFVALTTGFSVEPEVIVMMLEATLSPQAFVHLAEYVPADVTVSVLPVAFVLHFTTPLHPLAVNTTGSVPQVVVLFA